MESQTNMKPSFRLLLTLILAATIIALGQPRAPRTGVAERTPAAILAQARAEFEMVVIEIALLRYDGRRQ
jgi:hypothetical protein